jgi:ATP/maltotriose-dependent transcriptional regulator MalT
MHSISCRVAPPFVEQGRQAGLPPRVDPSDLVESKLRPPPARPGIVSRGAVVDRLLDAPAAPLICVVAPPGYGKSTVLAQWSAALGGSGGSRWIAATTTRWCC